MSRDETIPAAIRARLAHVDNGVLADVVLNVLLRGTGVNTVIPSMMMPRHLTANVAAINQSAFTDIEIALLRQRVMNVSAHTARSLEGSRVDDEADILSRRPVGTENQP
jgi:hypothetical protein